MYHFTIPMALMDYVPVVLFGIAAVYLQKDLYYKMPKYAFAMLAAGTINVFAAGFLKATWKLLYAASICDFQALNTLFMPTQSLGFLLAGLSLMIYACGKNTTALSAPAVAPAVFKGTFIFLTMMVSGLGMMCAALSILAIRQKKKPLTILFVGSFVLALGMGYMASKDSASAMVNWIEQAINIGSQACLLIGVMKLRS